MCFSVKFALDFYLICILFGAEKVRNVRHIGVSLNFGITQYPRIILMQSVDIIVMHF